MSAQKWIFTQGQVFKLYQQVMSFNQALRIASELSSERDVLVRKEQEYCWSVYWKYRKPPALCM